MSPVKSPECRDQQFMGAPRKGQRESPDPPGFRQKFSHIITVAPKPRVEIQMQLLFSESVPAPLDIQWPKCFQLQGALPYPDSLTRGSAPGPRWGLCPQTPVIGSCSALAMVPPPTTDPFRRLWPSRGSPGRKILWVCPWWCGCLHGPWIEACRYHCSEWRQSRSMCRRAQTTATSSLYLVHSVGQRIKVAMKDPPSPS